MHHELVAERVTKRQNILGESNNDFLKPAHLRLPRPENEKEAVQRMARRLKIGKQALSNTDALKAAKDLVKSKAFTHRTIDPPPEKGGIVRDAGLRRLLRKLLEERGLNPDSYTYSQLKQTIKKDGPLTQKSGVPINSVVLLWTNKDPVAIQQNHYDYATGKREKLDAPNSVRLYDGQNNHHIEIRVATNKKGKEKWSGEVVSAFEATKRKLAKFRAFKEAGIPSSKALRKLSVSERKQFKSELRKIERIHSIVNRSDNEMKGGKFIMSLCEGEMLKMKHKHTKEVGYFVVAKLNKPPKNNIVVVPHWDARAAGERKDSEGKKIDDSKREEFTVTPTNLKELAPPDHPHALKIRVSPLGVVRSNCD